MSTQKKGVIHLLQEFSIPLIGGVFCALLAANLAPEWYQYWFGAAHHGADHGEDAHHVFTFGFDILGHPVGLHFLINDIFMVFFFGIAAKEITEAALPGGSLNPPRKALNPLLGTIGGVVGPVAVFFLAVALCAGIGLYDSSDPVRMAAVKRGWGIPTATDIALAWLVARTVFGKGHPAINFLLLLAVADDAIGLGIIAIFYGDPTNPAKPEYLLLVLLGMLVAFGMRKAKVGSWIPYIAVAGPLAWLGLIMAHLHPALALIFIVPFLPAPSRDTGLFEAEDEVDAGTAPAGHGAATHHSPLHLFEHQLKSFVDFGLFFFAMGNAGVELAGIGTMTWIILASLVVGKTVGIGFLSWGGAKLGIPLPTGMSVRDLFMASFIAALGLTVALFVAGAAFPIDAQLQGEAKMGALFSGFVGLAAVLMGKAFGFGRPGASSVSNQSEAA